MMYDIVDEKLEYRGVEYTITGGYTNAEKTVGSFVVRCKFYQGVAGDPETARAVVRRIVDRNLVGSST